MAYKIIASQAQAPATFSGLSGVAAIRKAAALRKDGWPFVIVAEDNGEMLDEQQLQRRVDEAPDDT